MHFLAHIRKLLLAGVAVLAVSVGAGATAAPASAAVAFCNAAYSTYDRYRTPHTAYAQCQITQLNVLVRARAWCWSGQVTSSEWKLLYANTNWFIGHNFRPNWNPYGFEWLYCSSGVRQVYVEGSFDGTRVFGIPVYN